MNGCCSAPYLFKEVHGCFGVLVQQVVKDQQDAGQVERHSLELRVHMSGNLGDGLGAEREHAAAARV